ncbi:MAG: ATP-dependent ligase [Verrucomicrobiales bacterium]|nr:ATP-dependent ligase [Verrucomicrobiales bacterium]
MSLFQVGKRTSLNIKGQEIGVSNLEHVLFPGGGFTKGQVIDYYIRASKYILPHLKDRPLTLKMQPKGVHGEATYERDARKFTPAWVKTADVWRKSGASQIHYLLANDLPTLVWLANLNNIEMHTFLARAPKVEQPTMVVFDLDPGEGADILQCAQVAVWLKEAFDHLKLKSLIKSSGSKGLHLYVPLNTPVTYEQTQPFAQAIAEWIETEHPELVTSSMDKLARAGKVFVDWNQNASYKSTVCVYSLRAKKDQPFVSFPMRWSELISGMEDNNFSVFAVSPEAALKRLEKSGDLFTPVLKLKQKLPVDILKVLNKARTKPRHNPPSVQTPEPHLEAYWAKRNFDTTAEPSGHKRVQQSQSKDRLFVIQKHDASHLHYDFRLEMQGVLRSWAVPKGPPLQIGERRLAMHVEDHPMDYAHFEGTIPEGQYGGGTVMVWDTGTYRVREDNPVRAYYGGKISLELHGKKLKGQWALVRAQKAEDGQKERWFLIKTEKDAPPISSRRDDASVLTGRSMEEIAKDRKSAQWNSNRAPGREPTPAPDIEAELEKLLRQLPRAEPRFVEPMKARLVSKFSESPGWIYELKFDGYRALAVKQGSRVHLLSRKNLSLNSQFPELVEAVKKLKVKHAVLDGEIVALDEKGRPSFLAIHSPIQQNGARFVYYYAFDLINLEKRDLRSLPLQARKQFLEAALAEAPEHLRFSSNLEAAPKRIVAETRRQGLEGVVAKRADSTYEAGERSGAWVKYKTSQEQEFVVGGYRLTRDGKDFDCLLVGYYENHQFRFAAKVKSGFGPEHKKVLGKKFKGLHARRSPFKDTPKCKGPGLEEENTVSDVEARTCVWLKPKVVVEVGFTGWTVGGHLRHSVFNGIREDKNAQDVVRESAE